MEIGLPVPDKKILKGFLAGHLGHSTSIMLEDFLILVPESFRKKFGQIGTVSEKM